MKNDKCQISPDRADGGRRYDLTDRTTRFAETTVRFARRVPQDAVTRPMITQLVRAGTSVAANNREANDAVSKRDFRNKIGICRKEANETKLWLQLVAEAVPGLKPDARTLWKEADELHRIFGKSFATASKRTPRSVLRPLAQPHLSFGI